MEIKLSDCKQVIDFRIDANTYKKAYLATEKQLKTKTYQNIEQLSTSVQNFGAYSLCNFINFVENGVPFLMSENVRHNYIDWNIQKFIDIYSHEMLYKSHCRKGNILITMAGEYLGRVAVYNKDFISSSNQAIAKVSLRKNYNPYVISTFLNSKFGQNQIHRLKTITGQPNINMSLIKSLIVPDFSKNFSGAIQLIINESEINKEESQSLYNQAENFLLKSIGLEYFKLSKDPVNVKSFKDSFLATGRLDAEYYQPKYEEISNAVKSYNKGYNRLEDLIDNYSTGYPYQSDSYSDEGIPLIRINNISKGGLDLSNATNIPFADMNLSIKDVANENDILISMSGTIGNSCKIPKGVKAVVNQRIMRITSKDFNVDVLPVIINSIIGKFQLDRIGTGGVQTNISATDIKKILVPKLEIKKQNKIAELVEKSSRLKEKSEKLLEVAKKAVEITIEETETKAVKFITDNTK